MIRIIITITIIVTIATNHYLVPCRVWPWGLPADWFWHSSSLKVSISFLLIATYCYLCVSNKSEKPDWTCCLCIHVSKSQSNLDIHIPLGAFQGAFPSSTFITRVIMSAVTDSCAVCGDRATKLRYSHYGATSCFSCRAFYRRAIEKGSFRNYACSLEGTCEITTKTRKKCPFCRFSKCKRVGMTHSSEKGQRGTASNTPVSAPLSPVNGTAEPLTEVDNEINGVLATFSASTSLMTPWVEESQRGFSLEDEAMVRKLVHLDRDHSFHIGESLCEASLTAIKAYINSAYSQTPLDFTAICWAYTKSIRKLTRFAQNIDDFNALDVNDRKTLLLENLDPMFNIRVGHFFSCDATTLLDQLECLAVFDVSNLQR